jgi:hypothetical protein
VEKAATIDEEFILLDSALAALKIEHEVFFRNPIKRPPADLKWKVLSLLRKFSDDSKMTFSQMYRYYLMAQRYAIYGDWRIREEGYRGRKIRCCPCRVRAKRNTKPRTRFMVSAIIRPGRQIRRLLLPVRCGCGTQKNGGLYKVVYSKQKRRQERQSRAPSTSFPRFVSKKSKQIRKESGYRSVKYTVEMSVKYTEEMARGQVGLKAKAQA